LSQATGDKGPTGPGGFPPDPFQYLQAQVGPVGPRGPPGIINISERFMGVGGSFGKSDESLPSFGSLKKNCNLKERKYCQILKPKSK
jgi:collagen type II alpha